MTISSLPTPHDTIRATVCQNHAFDSLSFYINAFETHLPDTIIRINRSQTFYHCDSVTILILTVLPSTYDTLRDEICQGNAYDGYGFHIPADSIGMPGPFITQRQLIQAGCGCDSLITLLLAVNASYNLEIQENICEGEGYVLHGFHVPPSETIGINHLRQRQDLQTISGCDSTIILDLEIIDTSITIDTYPYDFCEDYVLTLTASSPLGNYLWSTGETQASVEVHSPGFYSVTASSGDCSASTGISVQPCEMSLYLPNAITPSNHDGLNDDFHLETGFQRQIADFAIHIFDRWGNLVFASTDKEFRWRGEVKGSVIPNTTYNYIITYKDLYGEAFTAKGNITVL